MPPKKDLSSPVYTMPHERQVELLSEALLREYMHKRKFTETLQVFDTENPRDSDTISSRALMSDLMALDPDIQRTMKADGVETIMEMLCCLRVQRRLELEGLKQRALAKVPRTPEKAKKRTRDKKKTKNKLFSDDLLHGKELSQDFVSKRKNNTGRGSSSKDICSNSSSDSLDVGNANNNGYSNDGETGNERGCNGVINDDVGTCLEGGLVCSIMKLLCNGKPLPSAFVEHGFFFLEEVEYGLCQESPGLDGIIAAVQAFICACFFKKDFVNVQRHREHCLLRALTTLILNAQPNPRCVCLVDGSISADSAEADMMRLRLWRNLSTTQEVEDSILSLLERWMQPKGSGLFCFLLSVMLSCGIKTVASMMKCSTTLIDSRGRCSSDLTRLLLRVETDATTSSDVLGGLILGGNKGGMMCGYVSSGPDDTMLDDEGAKTPRFPVWVIQHDGRCIVLFLKMDDRYQFERRKDLGRTVSSNVFFYDSAAAERCEMFLTVSVKSAPVMVQQAARSSTLLYDVVRRIPIWSHGEIDLNGFEPAF